MSCMCCHDFVLKKFHIVDLIVSAGGLHLLGGFGVSGAYHSK